MKKKQFLLILIAAGAIAVGWLLSVRAASGVETRNAQKELVESADLLASKELYVRAIPKYEEALDYDTDSNTEIETRLLDAYLSFGDIDSYIDLVDSRISAGTATQEEYLTVAQYYLDNRRLENAITYLLSGMERLGAEQAAPLEELYEANRYTYSLSSTDFQTILPTSSNSYMPAYNGEKWGYVDNDGDIILDCIYDAVTPFNSSGISAVLYDGTYYCITKAGARYGVDETGVSEVFGITDSYLLAKQGDTYSYYNYDFECVGGTSIQYDAMTISSGGLLAVKSGDKWGVITDGGEQVIDFKYDDVATSSLGKVFVGGQAMVCEGSTWYLIDSEGNKVSENGYADAKAPESGTGYIAVADSSGRWGFIDRSGNLVIDYKYEDALSFSQHLAPVYIAGSWGYISEKNELVIDELLDWAQPFHNGVAQVGFLDMTGLITLEYTD